MITIDELREKIKRRAIVMDIGGFSPSDDPMSSWFGKVSYCLPGEDWPLQDGHPMHALAQINLLEMPYRPPRLSDIDLITIFIGPSELPIDAPNGTNWCLRAYQNTDALVPLKQVDSDTNIKRLPMRPKVIDEDYPIHEDIPDKYLEEALLDGYIDLFENVSGFKLGGWPSLIQSEIFWDDHSKRLIDPEYVFQIDTTEKGNWAWADGGVGYFGRGTTRGRENDWALAWQCY